MKSIFYTRLISYLFLIQIAVFTNCSFSEASEYENSLSRGQESYVRGEYQDAEAHYLKALRAAEKHNDQLAKLIVLGYLGRVYSAEKNDLEAERVFKERIALSKTEGVSEYFRIEVYYALALFYAQKDKCAETKQIVDEMRRTFPNNTSEDYKQMEDTILSLSALHKCDIDSER